MAVRNVAFKISTQVLENAVPDSQAQNTLTGLPVELLLNIARNLNVNDQVCLALTSKTFAKVMLDDKSLSCNSHKETVRFESWRFEWLPTVVEDDGSPGVDIRGRLASELKMRRIVRCKRKLHNDMMARLKARRRAPVRVEVEGDDGEAAESFQSLGENDWMTVDGNVAF